MKDFVVATFYKFFDFPDYTERQQTLLNFATAHHIVGTILLAAEGINATIAGTPDNIQSTLDFLQGDFLEGDRRLSDLTHKLSQTTEAPFKRLKVRLKKEIVTLGQPQANPTQQVGTYVPPSQWNDLIQDPEVTLIDTRNNYEVAIGTFKGATNPKTQSFRDFPQYVATNLDPTENPKVAMFCTGGIRCEKATAYLLSQGFREVYHLEGGILKYLEDIPQDQSLWQGECFVFDERVTVKHGLTQGEYELCFACGHPIDQEDKNTPDYEIGISCPYCIEALTPERRAKFTERWRQRQQQKNHQRTEPTP